MNVASGSQGSAVRALLGRGSIYTVAVAIQVSAGVLVLPILTRLLSPAELGVVSLALVVQAVLAIVAAMGLPASVMRTFFRAHGLPGARSIVALTAAVAFAVVLVALLTVPGWADAIGAGGDAPTIRIAVVSALGVAVLTASQSLLRAQDRAGRYVATVVVSTIGAQALGLAAAAALGGDSESYFAGLTVGILAGAALGVGSVGVGVAELRSDGRLGPALRIGLPTVPHSLSIYVLAAGDRAVIARIEDLAAVGQYQVAYLIGALGLTMLAAANNAWTPIVFGAPEGRRWEVLAETAAALWRLLPYAIGALAIGAPLALAVAAPGDYDPGGLTPVTAIVAFAAVPQLAYMGVFLPLYWEGRLTSLVWITPLTAVANIGLNIALVPSLGLEGAAAATVAAYGLLAALVWWRASGLAEIRWPLATMRRATLIAAILAAVGAAAPADGGWLALRGIAVAFLLVAAAWTARDLLRVAAPVRSE